MVRFCVAMLALAAVSSQAAAQEDEVFYYRRGEKVPLTPKPTKAYILLSADAERNTLEQSAKSADTVLRRFEPVQPLKTLELAQGATNKRLKWAIVDNITPNGAPLGQSMVADDIVYTAPFFVTQDGKEVGMSHLVYVKLKSEDDRRTLERLAGEHKVEVLGHNKLMPLWYTLSCSKESSGNALHVANRLYESGEFAAAEPDFLADFNIKCASDEHFGKQWGMKNTGQNGGSTGIDIGVCDAWNTSTGDSAIIVAVLDHGVELNHPDLPNMSTNSYDTVTASSPSRVRGNHGTACAGIIGAARNSGDLAAR